VFLPKAGVARGPVFAFLAAEIAGFLLFATLLLRFLRAKSAIVP
jgi:hypothetical protein